MANAAHINATPLSLPTHRPPRVKTHLVSCLSAWHSKVQPPWRAASQILHAADHSESLEMPSMVSLTLSQSYREVAERTRCLSLSQSDV
jgi:hypothetical protein